MELQPSSGYPLFYYCQKILPTVYDDSLSYYEAICKQSKAILDLAKNLDLTNEQISSLKESLSELETTLKDYTDSQAKHLYDLIVNLTDSSLDWDVTKGIYTDTKDAHRNLFNDVTVHSMTVGEFEEWANSQNWNVDDLSNCGLNCRGFAVLNYWLIDKNDTLPQRYKPSSSGEGDTFTVAMLKNAKVNSDNYVIGG